MNIMLPGGGIKRTTGIRTDRRQRYFREDTGVERYGRGSFVICVVEGAETRKNQDEDERELD